MARNSRKQDILDVALQLFSEKGVDGVSLREINAQAKLSAAALHYHFKTRDVLVSTLIESIAPVYYQARGDMLEQLALKNPLTMHDVVEVLVKPMSNRMRAEPQISLMELRFLSRLYFDESSYLDNVYQDGWLAFSPFLKQVLPQAKEQQLKLRWLFASELTLQSLINSAHLIHRAESISSSSLSFDDYVESLIQFIAKGVTE